MNPGHIPPIPNAGWFTAWVIGDHIEVLCRSADWYELSPIHRYLFNMAASHIRMEDAKTETRTYTFARYEHLRQLMEWSAAGEWDVAFEAFMSFSREDHHFGVVHLDQREGKRGNLLLGDDPDDYAAWCPEDIVMATFTRGPTVDFPKKASGA